MEKKKAPYENLRSANARLEQEVEQIVSLLEKEGRYNPVLRLQAEVVATNLIIVRKLRNKVLSQNFSHIKEYQSREGNKRYQTNPYSLLFIQYMDRLQDSLKALGMNTDSKEVKRQNKSLNDFLNRFRDDRGGEAAAEGAEEESE